MDTEDRWYVRFRGHTLGPLTSEQVKSSVRRKELGPDDKLASTSNPAWRTLRTEGDFLRCWEALTRPIPAELAPLPSPKILWQKKRAPLPAAPQSPAPAVAPLAAVPVAPPAAEAAVVQPKPSAVAKPAKAKVKSKPAKKAKTAKRAVKAKAKPAEPAQPVPEATPALANIPEKPEIAPAAPAAEPIPAEPAHAAAPKLAEETLSLLEALREWNRKEKETMATQPAPEPQTASAPKPSSAAPAPLAFARPEVVAAPAVPVAPSAAVPVAPLAAALAEKRGIELRLNLVISKQFMFISAIVAAVALSAAIYTAVEAKKMRGPVDSRLPDPSSPTVEPSPKDDPIPQLKAPTRPKRD